MSEFELIQQYFASRQSPVSHVALGIGDDCALLMPPDAPNAPTRIAISTDMLVEGRHFFAGADARMLGHKALAVNLSDLAAMGAQPRAFTLALALPEVNAQWLQDFSAGLFELATQFGCQLIGGDTTKGPLNICITVFGEVPDGFALRRDRAKAGDDIWVSGALGDARLALAGYLNQRTLSAWEQQQSALRLHTPTPQIALGLALRAIAHAAIDVSDGLSGDLGHILNRSNLGATLWCDALPIGVALQHQDKATQLDYALSGGDDYELCFTASPANREAVLAAAQRIQTSVTRIGIVESERGIRLVDVNKQTVPISFQSFDHFQS